MSKKFIITILGIFVVVGGGFFILLGWGSELPTAKSPAPATTVVSPTPLPPPTVSVTEEDAKTGNIVLIQWKDLPGGATELEVFRSPKGKDQWSLWETISLT